MKRMCETYDVFDFCVSYTLKKFTLLYYDDVIVMVIYVKNILIPRHQVGTSASSLTIDNILCVIR